MISTQQRARRGALTVAAMTLTAAALSGCSGGVADPSIVSWSTVSSQHLVALDDATGIFVSGSWTFGSGQLESTQIIDYKYAYSTSDGGVRQSLVSELWAQHSPYVDYPGASAVTIYQDADEGSNEPRIDVLECDLQHTDEYFDRFKSCSLPDGTSLGDAKIRIDIHVPAGSFVQEDALSGQ